MITDKNTMELIDLIEQTGDIRVNLDNSSDGRMLYPTVHDIRMFVEAYEKNPTINALDPWIPEGDPEAEMGRRVADSIREMFNRIGSLSNFMLSMADAVLMMNMAQIYIENPPISNANELTIVESLNSAAQSMRDAYNHISEVEELIADRHDQENMETD